MSFHLFFDTETSGLPLDWRRPMEDVDNWPRLVQLGYLVTNDQGILVNKAEFIVKPSGFEIPEHVSRVHGITTERAMTEGKYVQFVMNYFHEWTLLSDTIVGHNSDFDVNVLGAEFIRQGRENPFKGKTIIDTMKSSTDYCKIPSPYRMGGYKWPKLSELYERLFNVPLAQSHTALDDIQATAKCFFELKRLGVINLEKEKI